MTSNDIQSEYHKFGTDDQVDSIMIRLLQIKLLSKIHYRELKYNFTDELIYAIKVRFQEYLNYLMRIGILKQWPFDLDRITFKYDIKLIKWINLNESTICYILKI